MRSMMFLPNQVVLADQRPSRIVAILDSLQVVIEDCDTGDRKTAKAQDLQPFDPEVTADPSEIPLEQVSEKYWNIAETRLAAIRPLLAIAKRSRADVQARAREVGFGQVSLYDWLRRYQASGSTSSLLPRVRSGGPPTKLSSSQELLIKKGIETVYLQKQRLTPQNLYRELRRVCSQQDVKPPSAGTLRNRLARLDPSLVARRRLGTKAQQSLKPIRGTFPGADSPLSVVEVDHTELDIEVVDEQHRRAIGRPWITLAIDVYSRMITGYYISLDPPGDISTGLCLVHSILPKGEWLSRHEVDADWPCQGFMKVIHVDNAKEFHSQTLVRACSEYDIALKHRPVARPHYGGTIERMLGTTLRHLHTLPGTTFSNVQQKGEYDSDRNAALTLRELERSLAVWVTGVYHRTFHKTLLTTPLEKYRLGVSGIGGISGPLTVRLPQDAQRLRNDFLPSVHRTIQPYGVVIDEIYYWHDILRPWIHALDPSDKTTKRTFLFKRDPRDVSVILFYDPIRCEYHEVPYRDISRPPLSVWELRAARRRLKEEGRKVIDEHAIFESYARIHQESLAAVKKTRAARRQISRSPVQQKQGLHSQEFVTEPHPAEEIEALYREPITPFVTRSRT